MSTNDEIAQRLGITGGWFICECGHGLYWHDNHATLCRFYRTAGVPECFCQRFSEAAWSKARHSP